MSKGWFGQKKRHRVAALKGHQKRRTNISDMPVSEYEANYIQNKRTYRAKKTDSKKTAKECYPIGSKKSYKWRTGYKHIDLRNIDDSEIEQNERVRKQIETTKKRKTKQHTQDKFKKRSRADVAIGDNRFYRKQLELYAQRRAADNDVDIETIDTESIIDPSLSYSENKKILRDEIHDKSINQMSARELQDKIDDSEAEYYNQLEELQYKAESGDKEAQVILESQDESY